MVEAHLFTEGRITKDYPAQIKAQIESFPSGYAKIIHHIQSPGGDCYAAFNGYHEIMKAATKGVIVDSQIEGEAQSMGTFLAVAPAVETGGKVSILDPSTFMIHEPFFPEGVAGTVDELQSAKEELEQIRTAMANAYAKKTGKPVEEMMALMKKTTRLDAKMAVEMGFCDMIPTRQNAIGELLMNEIKNLKTEVMSLFKRRAIAGPAALDLPTKDGKMLMVETDNSDLVNKPATIDGVPAEGDYELADGRVLTCAGGVVTAVKEAAAPPEQSAQQKLEAQLKAMQDQLAGIKAAEEAKIKAEEEAKKVQAEQAKVEELAKALEEQKKLAAEQAAKIEALENKPIGDASKPMEGMKPNRTPFGAGNKDERLHVMATRTFLASHLPWLERHYPSGKYADGTRFIDYRENGPNAVSILETNLNYTWNGILDTDILFKPTVGTPAISDVFNIDLGAADKKRYHIAPVMNKVLKPYTGCGQAVTGSSFDITSKAIQLKPFEMYEGWCKDDFTDQLSGSYNVLAQEWLKTGVESFDPAGTPIDKMIIKQLKDALRRDTWRRISFGDTTSSSADWNQIDGLWQSLIDQAGASNYCVYRSGAALGTGALAADTALNYFKAIFKDSSNILKEYAIDSGNGKFLVTRSIWENYYDSLVDKGSVSNDQYNNLLKGIQNLTYKGIPVVPITVWDDQLADSTNPLSSTTRHLIAFTVKDNHVLGIENTADMDKIDSWFEKKDNKRYYRSNFTMGFLGALHCDLTTISY